MNWVSVKNQMPKMYQKVLVYTKQGRIEIGEVCQNDSIKFNDEVTHWMPLPDKPCEPKDIQIECKHEMLKITKYGYQCKYCGQIGFSLIHG